MDLLSGLLSVINNPLFTISLVFWILTFGLSKILSKKYPNAVTFFFPFIAMFRTKLFNRMFRWVGSRGRKLWRIIWNIGIVVSFVLMIYAIYFFTANLIALIVNPKPENALVPLIPGVTIGLPIFSYFILPLLFVLTVHEFSHAIAAEIDDINIKTSGLLGGGIFFVVLYGGFVEVDDFQLDARKTSSKTRMRVSSAGIWSNIILALIVFGIMANFSTLMHGGYDREIFQVNTVITLNNGGFNEGNIFPGDMVLEINDTQVDMNDNRDLDDILNNRTALKCSVGDHLIFNVQTEVGGPILTREIVLGHRSFVGFDYTQFNNTAIQIGEIYPAIQGGNNEGYLQTGKIITKIDGIAIDYSNVNTTLAGYLKLQRPNYHINLTDNTGQNFTISVNYYPAVAGAHYLEKVFTGLIFEQVSNSSIRITQVLSNTTENGINEGRIPESTIVTEINGIALDLSEMKLKEFVTAYISPQVGDAMVFTSSEGTNYTINTSEIPVISVYVGILPKSYWLAKNWVGILFGPTFPNWFELEIALTWMISFSVALFNLLPVSIFDGGRLVKELIQIFVGSAYKLEQKKRIRYEHLPKDGKVQPLMIHNIQRVISVHKLEVDANPANNYSGDDFPSTPIRYTPIDSYANGLIDSIEIYDADVPNKKCYLEVEFDYEQDIKEPKKKRILSLISWSIGLIILFNFILSLTKLGTGIFWL